MPLKNSGPRGVPGKANPDVSEVYVTELGGYGSAGTQIPYFVNVIQKTGSDILYLHDVVVGDSFRIQTSGYYSLSLSMDAASGTQAMAITRNQTDLTQDAGTGLPSSQRVIGGVFTSAPSCISVVTYLYAGDVIRANTSAASANTSTFAQHFKICKVS